MTFRESGAIRKQNHLRDPAAAEAGQALARKLTPSHHGARARAAGQPGPLSAAMPAPFMEAFRVLFDPRRCHGNKYYRFWQFFHCDDG